MPRPLYEYLDSQANPAEIEEEEGESSEVAVTTATSTTSYNVIRWSGGRKKIPIVAFSPHVLLLGLQGDQRQVAEKYHLAYKFVKTECKLVRSILDSHCFRELYRGFALSCDGITARWIGADPWCGSRGGHRVHPNSPSFNLMWTGSHLKPHTLRGMQDFQKVNHFPRSYELTRKDRLYKNIQRLQHLKGYKHFDYIPNSFVLPEEYNEFYSAFMKDKGPWIVKPVASSRGRGIYLTNHPSQVPLDENLLVCKYISNPLLIDGFKFDVRLYVGVTSYDPLRIYLYEEGLTRFATVKYDKSVRNIGNTCMHLTNYSVNKKSENFVSCQDPEVEDYGNKWSMSALLRYLKEKGRDTAALMMRIEDVVIKTIIAGELPIASACKMFMPHPGNCFEIYGFDILIDERLRPWLLEVNLSPSLACESPLDLKIKSHLITDMFNLVGYVAHDPLVRRNPIRRVPDYAPSKTYQKQRTMSAGPVLSSSSLRPSSSRRKVDETLTLTSEEMRILRQTNEEHDRRGGFVRIFPTSESWELYGSFLEHRTTHNQMIHSKLFPGKKASIHRPTTASLSSATARAKNLTTYGTSQTHSGSSLEQSEPSIAGQEELSITSHITCYERKLDSWSPAILQSRSTENIQSPSTGSLDQQPSSHSLSKLQDSHLEVQREMANPTIELTDNRPQERTSLSQTQATLETSSSITFSAPKPRVQSAKEARPPRPQASNETVSKRVLSAQPTFKAIRIEDIMDKSGSLTKLQARQAFAMYLQRVQQRLIYEANYDSDDSTDSSRQDEQMSLVIRFLKKAAGNLQQPFKVVIPSRKLPLHDRRRILAKQLGDFVHIYGKETNQIQKRQEISRTYGLNRNTSNDNEIADEDFKIFMAIACETELEDLLTRYTKLNKSANVFLGGPPEKAKEDDVGIGSVETGLNRRKEPETSLRVHLRSKSSSAQGDNGWARPQEDYEPPSNASLIERHNRALTAVSAYGTSVALNKTKSRPASAKFSSTRGSDKTSRASRPFSAKISRDHKVSATDDSDDSTTQQKGYQKTSEQAVAQALQKLAKRQSARQYSPLASNTTTSTNWRDILRKLDHNADQDLKRTNDDGYASIVSHMAKQDNNSHGYYKKDSVKSHNRDANANATFNSFVNYDRDDSDEQFPRNAEVETAMHRHARSHPSQWRSLRIDLPKEHDEQRMNRERFEDERKAPLELKKSISREDYNRHIQLLNQKLSEQKLSAQQPCLPHPPPGPSPARKIINAKRMARLAASHDQGVVNKQQDVPYPLTNGYS